MKLVVAYLGGGFHGWQRQPHATTVQGELERAFTAMTGGLEANFVAAGRTDAGVHAAGQTSHVDLDSAIPPHGLQSGLNAKLPPEIRIRSVCHVPDSFHARRSALGKLYTYRARFSPAPLPWRGLRSARVPRVEKAEEFARALLMLPGTRDMGSFTVDDPAQGATIKTLYRVWHTLRADGATIHFVGAGFLRYQVRRMVGAALAVGSGDMSLSHFGGLLNEAQPGARIHTAPASGLTLERVFYRSSPLLTPLR